LIPFELRLEKREGGEKTMMDETEDWNEEADWNDDEDADEE